MGRPRISCAQEHPANHSASLAIEKGSTTGAASSCLLFLKSLGVTDLDGLSGKMSPECFLATEDGILAPSSGRWGNWGTGGHTGCWTLSGSECPKDAEEFFLWRAIEIKEVPQRYFLSKRACAGILRRLQRKGRSLSQDLVAALGEVAAGG